MRISGGVAKGVPLVVPPGDAVRPATDGLRQAVFSSLGARVVEAHFLDLFAGSGSYGLEALSRGAHSGIFVEKGAKASACLQRNLVAVAKSLRKPALELAHLSQSDVLAWAPRAGSPLAELVFIDPPYELIPTLAPQLFAKLETWVDSAKDPLVFFETPGEIVLSAEGWEPFKRIGGKSQHQPGISVFRKR